MSPIMKLFPCEQVRAYGLSQKPVNPVVGDCFAPLLATAGDLMAGNMLKTSYFCRLHAICMCCHCCSRLLLPEMCPVSSLESLHDLVISLRSGRDEAWGRIEKMWSASPSFLLLPFQELVGRCQPGGLQNVLPGNLRHILSQIGFCLCIFFFPLLGP